jgi:hypothetical protein
MKSKDQPPSQAEHTQLRTFLAGKGMNATAINQLVGATPSGRTRRQLAAALTQYLRTAPKA